MSSVCLFLSLHDSIPPLQLTVPKLLLHLPLQVIYGAAITDPISVTTFVALTDYWIHTGGPKREPGRYHTPPSFFAPGTRLSTLVQVVENANPPLVLTAELCGLYNSPIVSDKAKGYVIWKLDRSSCVIAS